MKMNSPLGRSDLTPSYQHDLVVKMFNRTYVSISFPYIFTYFHMCSYISIYIFTCIHTFPYILAWVFYIFIHTLHGLCIFHCFFTGKSHRGHQTRARAPACTVGSNHYLLYDARWAPTTRMPQEASFFGGLLSLC